MFSPQSLLIAGAVFLCFLLVGLLLRAFVFGWALPRAAERGLVFAQVFLRSLRGLLLLWAILAGLLAALRYLQLPSEVGAFVDPALGVVLVLSLVVYALRLIGFSVRLFGERSESFRSVAGIVERLAQIVVAVLGALMLLSYIPNLNITPLLTGLGVAGLATALALQDTLANFFAGIYVLADRPVRPGDYARLNDSNVEGYVVSVGWRSTRLRTLANNIVVVPNLKLAQSVVTNYDLPEKRLGLSTTVRVAMDSDPERVLRVLTEVASEAAAEVDGMLSEPPPRAQFSPGVGEYGLEFTITYQVRQFADQFTVQNELQQRILARFRREGIQVPQPVRTVQMGPEEPHP